MNFKPSLLCSFLIVSTSIAQISIDPCIVTITHTDTTKTEDNTSTIQHTESLILSDKKPVTVFRDQDSATFRVIRETEKGATIEIIIKENTVEITRQTLVLEWGKKGWVSLGEKRGNIESKLTIEVTIYKN